MTKRTKHMPHAGGRPREPGVRREPNGRKSRSHGTNWLVYFIEASGFGLVKIGYTNNVDMRLLELSVGSPFELKVIETVGCIDRDDARRTEKHFQVRFNARGHHVRGEWFRLTEAEIETAKAEFFDAIFGSMRQA